MAGWGVTNITTKQTAKILKFVQVMVKNNVDCKIHWRGWFSLQTNICAGNNVMRQDACEVNENRLMWSQLLLSASYCEETLWLCIVASTVKQHLFPFMQKIAIETSEILFIRCGQNSVH